MAALMIANILGTGVLSLPYAASALGWLPFSLALAAFTLAALYSGLLYARLFAAAPASRVLADVAAAAYGPRMRRAVGVVVYVYVGGITVIFHLTCTLAAAEVVRGTGVCVDFVSAAVAVPVFVLLQARDMHSVGGLSLIGALSILLPCALLLVELVRAGRRPDAHTELVAAHSTLTSRGVGLMDVAFAYAGQVIFIELQADMHTPSHFPRAVILSLLVMVATYAAIAATGYWYVGVQDLSDGKPITSHVGDGIASRVVNSFLAVHVLIAYVIEGNVLARGLSRVLPTPHKDGAARGGRLEDRLWWMGSTGMIVLCAFVLSNLLPFFSDIMGLMASMCAMLLSYTFPMLFARRLCPMRRAERLLTLWVLLPLSVLVAVGGTAASVASIAFKSDAMAPFACRETA